MPHKMETGTKPSVLNLSVLFCQCAVQKATANVDTKDVKYASSVTKGFRGIFVGIPQHQKGYPVYVPITWKQFLHMTFYLTKYFLLNYHTHQVRIQRPLLFDEQSHIFFMLHHLMKKMATL